VTVILPVEIPENIKDNILAMFCPGKYTHTISEIGHVEGTKITIWTRYHNPQEIRNFNTIIYSPSASRIITNDDSIIEKELLRKLEEGGHICILCDSESDHDQVIADILFMVSGKILGINRLSEINIHRSEFRDFLRSYGIVSNVFVVNINLESVICTMNYVLADSNLQNEITKFKDNAVIGFTLKKIKGLITFLPFHMGSTFNRNELPNLVMELAEALDTHRKNLIFQPPSWINIVRLDEEEKIRNRISELGDELQLIRNLLDKQLELKSVLWVKHSQLVEACIAVLDSMGIKSVKDDIGEEDFWILKQKTKVIISECKGKDNNLTREDVSMLDIHRDARGKDENFPALLIVNNFNKVNSLAEKDIPIASNVIQHAVKLNILVIRSLDLIGLLDLYQKKSISSSDIIGYFSKSAGWMKVSDGKIEIFSR